MLADALRKLVSGWGSESESLPDHHESLSADRDGVAHPPFRDVVAGVEELRQLYPPPGRLGPAEKVDELDEEARAFIGLSPFMLMATADDRGRCTVSPRGGAPGFVGVIDERHLAIPDFAGNDSIDCLRNLVTNPHIGLLFVLPGQTETVRVDGRAWVSTDPILRKALQGEQRLPRTAIGVQVIHAFVHCPKSFNRARVWDTASWERFRSYKDKFPAPASAPRARAQEG
jgi:PPOX class probable FMN-dependent enzyme